jgi:hypothetical protein
MSYLEISSKGSYLRGCDDIESIHIRRDAELVVTGHVEVPVIVEDHGTLRLCGLYGNIGLADIVTIKKGGHVILEGGRIKSLTIAKAGRITMDGESEIDSTDNTPTTEDENA